MGRKKITRKAYYRRGYHRRGYIRKDGTRVKACYIPPSYVGRAKIKDVGKPGKTPEREKWFAPKVHTGWKKTDSATTRRRKLLAAAGKKDHKKTYRRKAFTAKRGSTRYKVKSAKVRQSKYLIAARMAQQLANVTTDSATKRLARQDAQYFFRKAKKS